jgi:amino acid transporter
MSVRRFMSYIWGWLVALCFSFASYTFASAISDAGSEFPLGDGTEASDDDSAIDFWQLVKDDAIDPTDSASEQIQEALGIAYSDAENQRATYYIQQMINRFLAIIWLVSLIVLVYGFYQMFAAKDNAEAFQEALKIVKWAVIAIFVIGVSRYIVSLLFDLFFAAKEDIE